jgi:hypothetical protein
MRVIFKIFSVLFALYILSILFVSPAKAACSEDAYGNCTGTCNCASYDLCGSCSCKWQSENYCGATGCSPCPTNTPKPTPGQASPTVTPPGCWCQNGKCVGNLTFCRYIAVCPTPACSQFSQNANIQEYCKTTNQTCGIKHVLVIVPPVLQPQTVIKTLLAVLPSLSHPTAPTMPQDATFVAIRGQKPFTATAFTAATPASPTPFAPTAPGALAAAIPPTPPPQPPPRPRSAIPSHPKRKKILHLCVFVS